MGLFNSIFGGGTQQTTVSSNPWAKPYYKDLYKTASDMYHNGGFYGTDYFNGGNTVAGLNPMELSAMGDIFNQGGAEQNFLNTTGMNALGTTLGAFDPNNPAITGAINSSIDMNTTNFMRNVMPNINAGAANAGMVGSNRQGVAQGLAMSDLNKQNLNIANQFEQQAYSQHQSEQSAALNNLPGIIAGLNSGANAQMGVGQQFQDQSQTELNAAIQAWAYHNNLPLENLSAFQSLISGMRPDTSISKSPSGGGLAGVLGSMAGSFGGGMV